MDRNPSRPLPTRRKPAPRNLDIIARGNYRIHSPPPIFTPQYSFIHFLRCSGCCYCSLGQSSLSLQRVTFSHAPGQTERVGKQWKCMSKASRVEERVVAVVVSRAVKLVAVTTPSEEKKRVTHTTHTRPSKPRIPRTESDTPPCPLTLLRAHSLSPPPLSQHIELGVQLNLQHKSLVKPLSCPTTE